jgi:hypothetical protein
MAGLKGICCMKQEKKFHRRRASKAMQKAKLENGWDRRYATQVVWLQSDGVLVPYTTAGIQMGSFVLAQDIPEQGAFTSSGCSASAHFPPGKLSATVVRLFGLKLLGQYIDDMLARTRLCLVWVIGSVMSPAPEQTYRPELI